MKIQFMVSVIFLSGLLISCVKPKSVAGAYKEKQAKGAVEGGGGEGDVVPEGEGDTGGEGDTAAPAGDAEAGKKLLTSCAGCHNASGPGAKVKLDATAVERLTDAYEGAKKDNHTSLSAACVDGRADLEAALNESAAALKLLGPVKTKGKK